VLVRCVLHTQRCREANRLWNGRCDERIHRWDTNFRKHGQDIPIGWTDVATDERVGGGEGLDWRCGGDVCLRLLQHRHGSEV